MDWRKVRLPPPLKEALKHYLFHTLEAAAPRTVKLGGDRVPVGAIALTAGLSVAAVITDQSIPWSPEENTCRPTVTGREVTEFVTMSGQRKLFQ